jgi:hypothetical protein
VTTRCSPIGAPVRTSDRPERIFDAVRSVIDATGLEGQIRRALDVTLLDDAVATEDPSPRSSRPSAGAPGRPWSRLCARVGPLPALDVQR